MSRLFPVVLLAFGLVLAFSVLAAAKTPQLPAGPDGVICIEEIVSPPVAEARQPEPQAVRCWKKLRTGLAVTSCGPDPVLEARAVRPAAPRTAPPAPEAMISLARCTGPDLDLPPPRV